MGQISGRVTGGVGGAPMDDVTVIVEEVGSPSVMVQGVATGADGVFSLTDLPVGRYVLHASPRSSDPWLPTYAPGTVRRPDAAVISITDAAPKTVNISLAPAVVLTGALLNADGTPSTQSLQAWSARNPSSFLIQPNANGTFHAKVVPDRKIGVFPSGGPVNSVRSIVVVDAVSPGVKNLGVLRIPGRTATITATVKFNKSTPWDQVVSVADQSGFLAASCEVGHPWSRDRNTTSSRWNCTVSKSGKMTAKVPPGSYRVVLDGTNVSKKVVAKAGKTVSVGGLKQPKIILVAGKVTDAKGKARAKCWVSFKSRLQSRGYQATMGSIPTNKAVTYLGSVAPGQYEARVSGPCTGDAKHPVTVIKLVTIKAKQVRPIRVTAGNSSYMLRGVRLDLSGRSRSVSGRVVNTRGEPVEGVCLYHHFTAWKADPAVQARTNDLEWYTLADACSDANGQFKQAGVSPGKGYLYYRDTYDGGYLPGVVQVSGKSDLKNVKIVVR